ncbi:hypothetical protein BCY86_06585 [Pajaroellobacter abortibovis]|uniref:Peptidase S9 prolyl oligopeptidase catalytic domain-containing protein n=1 Tax=Pajaroellobacter abortibovis TaxID=1882918 RepID=A0A1L6MXY5_9BACT|nr:hypothetical protein BCY86_06585 [Pajaroellobacter abortibovis]
MFVAVSSPASPEMAELHNPSSVPPLHEEAEIVPGHQGHVGAWLIAGPYSVPSLPLELQSNPITYEPFAVLLENSEQVPSTLWKPIFTSKGALRLNATWKGAPKGTLAYLGGVLRLHHSQRILLLIGVNGPLTSWVDQQVVHEIRQVSSFHEDEFLVSLDLSKGDHPILFKLEKSQTEWLFRIRVMDEHLSIPDQVSLVLPGIGSQEAEAMAEAMASISITRQMEHRSYHPFASIQFEEGTPTGISLQVEYSISQAFPSSSLQPSHPPIPTPSQKIPQQPRQKSVAVFLPEYARKDPLIVPLPPIQESELAQFEGKNWQIEVKLGGRRVESPFYPRALVRQVIARADSALARLQAHTPPSFQPDVLDSVLLLRERAAQWVAQGDGDLAAQDQEIRELDRELSDLEKGINPYSYRTGVLRRAYRSPLDEQLSEYGLYVPSTFAPGKKRLYPLIVALHGLNGRPLAMLRSLLGFPPSHQGQEWEDRHLENPPTLDAFVLVPSGRGNSMYREMGEEDVMHAIHLVTSQYPIDLSRISMTGVSMGGTGSTAIAFRHPDHFAAIAALCGYHSYFVRQDMAGKALKPWEQFLAEERSPTEWAWNGLGIPLWVVHGIQDKPESNSNVLIERYQKLHYPLRHHHPFLGHNVWDWTYQQQKGAKWLLSHKKIRHPKHVRFRTARLRTDQSHWLRIHELKQPGLWGEVDATIRSPVSIAIQATGVAAISIDRDPLLLSHKLPIQVSIQGSTLQFPPDEPIHMHQVNHQWFKGKAERPLLWKKKGLSGPFRDIFHEPLLFVYGASIPEQASIHREIAQAFASVRGGVTTRYPILSDTEFFERKEPLANSRCLFLIGNSASNRVVRALEFELPIRIVQNAIFLGEQRITGNQLGAAFIFPNPAKPDRYIAIVEGVTAVGAWRSLSLPDILPDFIIYDEQIASAKGQIVLGNSQVKAAGFFENNWSLQR